HVEGARDLVGRDDRRDRLAALDLADIRAVQPRMLGKLLLRPRARFAQLAHIGAEVMDEVAHRASYATRAAARGAAFASLRSTACVMFAPAGTSCVSHTLPPITAPRPIVTRPRIVAPA